MASLRSSESPEFSLKRLKQSMTSMASLRASESPECVKKPLDQSKTSMASLRASESPECAKNRLKQSKTSMASLRVSEYPECVKKRFDQSKISMASLRASESQNLQLLLFLVLLNMAASTISSTIMLCMHLQSRKEVGKHLSSLSSDISQKVIIKVQKSVRVNYYTTVSFCSTFLTFWLIFEYFIDDRCFPSSFLDCKRMHIMIEDEIVEVVWFKRTQNSKIVTAIACLISLNALELYAPSLPSFPTHVHYALLVAFDTCSSARVLNTWVNTRQRKMEADFTQLKNRDGNSRKLKWAKTRTTNLC